MINNQIENEKIKFKMKKSTDLILSTQRKIIPNFSTICAEMAEIMILSVRAGGSQNWK